MAETGRETHHVLLAAAFSLPRFFLFFFLQFCSCIYCFYTLSEAAGLFFIKRNVPNSFAPPGEPRKSQVHIFLQVGM